ncbi:MAG: 4-hydroxythreonine-4-phosphate dehydrogenase PdxA [Marinilabiliales bacterium]
MSPDKIIVGITQGDLNGIGYEIIIKTFRDIRMLDFCTPVIYGSPKAAAYHRKALNIDNFSLNHIISFDQLNHKRTNIINCLDDNIKVELGKETNVGGMSAFSCLEAATKDMLDGKFVILVTAPINKHNIQSSGFNFPGHTEYLKEKFKSDDTMMIMVSEQMKIGVVTGHIPIKDVPAAINKDIVLKKINALKNSLIEDFAIRKPKIAVLGLNPHAGDKGLIGDEEEKYIIPAINEAKENDIMALGPYSADGLFGSGQYKNFDAILAMYHDQGLTPFKALSFDYGVNYTAGLPIIRTSPAHGTAFDIAGENKADENSFRQAVFTALEIYKNRSQYHQLMKNPLKSYYIEESEN